MRHYVSPDQKDWADYLGLAEFAYNSAWQESIKASPFKLAYGQQPRVPAGGTADSPRPAAKSFAEQLALGIARAKACLHAAQQRQKAFADRHRRDVEYEVGNQVLLSTRNLRL